MFDELRLFVPGPTYLSERVKQAALLPEFGHRDSECSKRMEPAMGYLRKILELGSDCSLLILPGTGSTALEASMRSLVGAKDKLLCVSVGAFGDLYDGIARANGLQVESLRFDDGSAIDEQVLQAKLEDYAPDVVAMTHNETSTGVTNDVVHLSRLVRKYNALPLVDGVSIMGGAPSGIGEGSIGMYSGSTQKCLGLPAGFGIAAISEDALEKAEGVRNRGYNSDVLLHLKKNKLFQTLSTTSTVLANQLYVQTRYIIEEEGLDNRFKRHEEMRAMTHKWIEGLPEGFSLLPERKDASPSVSCMQVPEDFDREKLKERMRKRGYLADTGYGKLSVATIRIPHMGEITEEMLAKYLEELEQEITLMCAPQH